ncbi:NAD-dependent epimerase/dehydratase family protein [Stutzerimonas stutzeri]|uniref:NAD-dependent epimerase/dehydratase family protein n=1 Tax=Stutzerimonas stutzeri TaxID=316 RepID=UPI001BD13D83|nr:NAD-dependent epimerase/dehydratase family protein [Stutzerimonas stutzeri]
MKILLSGANGFLGSQILKSCELRTLDVLACARDADISKPGWAKTPSLDPTSEWGEFFSGIDVVIHAAAIAHRVGKNSTDYYQQLQNANIQGTLNLARQAAAAGIRRFIFISSIGVNGSINTRPFTVSDRPNPAEPYAQSKWEAEQGLWKIQLETGMELVIIRAPLVYGPEAPGNFGSLVRWIDRGIPLPLGAIHNKRSLVGIDNLVDLIVRCIDHPAAANRVLLAGDGEDLSTTELLRAVGQAMGKPARLIPVPTVMLQCGAALLGKKAMAQRLVGSLQVDITQTCELLDWKPPYTVEEGLRRCFLPVD